MPPRPKRQVKTEDEEEASANAKFSWTWKEDNGIVVGDCGTKPSDKILSFDMDSTLIKVKSGAKFAKDEKDWIILNDKVVTSIKEYYEKGYKIAIMTNQGGVEKGHTTVPKIQGKIEKIVEFIGVPIQVFIAPWSNQYRKPGIGMWKYLVKNMNGGIQPDMKNSIYCGDAAGRAKTKTRPADHDSTDYKFAINCGLEFKTPEMLFYGEKDELGDLGFDPRKLKTSVGNTVIKGKDNSKIKGADKEMIIFCGSPGSGKSTIWRNYLADYVRVNNDTLKSRDKCLKAAEEALKEGKSLVIDNTNPAKDTRKLYIDLAKKYKFPVRCFYFDLPKELAFHLDDLRSYNVHREHESKRVGKTPVHTWYKYVEPPTKSEGFEEIEVIQFVPGPFKSKDDEEMFYCFVSAKR